MVKDKQAQAAQLFEAARLQRGMVFKLDDKSIPEIDLGTSDTGVVPQGGSIALNLSARKQKRADSEP